MSSDSSSNFDRVLSKKDITALAFGAMIGWAWVVLTGEWIRMAGVMGAMLGFVLGGIMVLFVGLTYAELTSAMPKCGGEHVFSHRALGEKASFVCTWAIILGYVSVVAFEAVAFPTVIEYLFPSYLHGYMYTIASHDVYLTWVLVGSISSIVITIVNYFGVKPAAFFQGVVTILILCIGIALFGGALFSDTVANTQPLFVNGRSGVFAVMIMTPFLYVGFDVIPQAAEEINVPFKTIGKIIILSLVMAIAWYLMMIYSTSVGLSASQLETSSLATADAMQAIFNSSLASKILLIGGIGGILTSWNSFFVGGSRAIYAMAESNMLPSFLAKLHPKYKTPVNAIVLIGVISTFAPLLGRSMLVWLTNAGALGIVISYLIVSISFLVLRKNEPDMPRPYKVKHGVAVGSIAVILCLVMLSLYIPGGAASLIWPEWAMVIGWVLLGLALYAVAKLSSAGDEVKKERSSRNPASKSSAITSD
ncbi:amino acid/polyamine/organocation transporter, APC superfamily [Natronincola peptidivorans]|uniref:Amino acid/polyamine/organocation transporter, APC superfamily n=1 Tax=Natronincola peptidivorans TaxID=426128 RepID=A0A1I0C6X0_9FIRM|nr:APC family permease [Natronincola peptidivorans]SET15228.1 amino acid/polyamine/organocation transporter, APC superfamily [Natronincola peptidivorans]